MENALGQKPFAVLAGDDYVVLFRDEAQIRAIHPDMTALQRRDLRGVAITAPGKDWGKHLGHHVSLTSSY